MWRKSQDVAAQTPEGRRLREWRLKVLTRATTARREAGAAWEEGGEEGGGERAVFVVAFETGSQLEYLSHRDLQHLLHLPAEKILMY